MSKKLVHAISKGNVTVKNRTTGEVRVILLTEAGTRRAVDVPPSGTMELAPRLTSLKLISRSPNLKTLLKGPLRLV